MLIFDFINLRGVMLIMWRAFKKSACMRSCHRMVVVGIVWRRKRKKRL